MNTDKQASKQAIKEKATPAAAVAPSPPKPDKDTLIRRIMDWQSRPVFKSTLTGDDLFQRVRQTVVYYGVARITTLFETLANGPDPHPSRFWDAVQQLKNGHTSP